MNNTWTKTRAFLFSIAAAATTCAVVVFVWYFATTNTLVLVLGIFLSGLIGIVCYLLAVPRHEDSRFDILQTLFELSRDPDVSQFHKKISKSLIQASRRQDNIYRELLMERLNAIADEVKSVGDGRIEFGNTESWRLFYEQILRSPGTHLYRSVAHIETQSYWQDGAGRKSTELNLELHDSGKVSVERIAIIADHLWPPDELFPVSGVHEWLEEQHRYGIWILLLRESELANEKELISDFGIYGNRAVGRQIVETGGRTTRFVLSFEYNDVENADSIWEKLTLFAVSYSDLLVQQH